MEKMASPFDIVVYARDTSGLTRVMDRISRDLDGMIRSINHYEENSEVNTFCQSQRKGKRIKVSPTLKDILKLSKKAYKLSHGRFDVSAGCLISFWKSKKVWDSLPSIDTLKSLLPEKPFSKLKICGNKVKWGVDNACLDFGGLGKGYIAQKCIDKLASEGYPTALVNAGGDIVAGDPKESETWKIGIERTDGSLENKVLHLENCAVATSGDYYQSILVEGERYSHIVDPQTVMPVKHRSNVTVIAPEGWEADFYASYFSILPPEKAVETANSLRRVEVLITQLINGSVRTSWSKGFMKYVR